MTMVELFTFLHIYSLLFCHRFPIQQDELLIMTKYLLTNLFFFFDIPHRPPASPTTYLLACQPACLLPCLTKIVALKVEC